MITEEDLAQQFNVIIEHTHPRVWELICHCYVRVITPQLKNKPLPNARYIGIYCPEKLITGIITQKNLLKEVAAYVGLVDVVCLNATNLMRDPMSKIKQNHPNLWLELLWVISH